MVQRAALRGRVARPDEEKMERFEQIAAVAVDVVRGWVWFEGIRSAGPLASGGMVRVRCH